MNNRLMFVFGEDVVLTEAILITKMLFSDVSEGVDSNEIYADCSTYADLEDISSDKNEVVLVGKVECSNPSFKRITLPEMVESFDQTYIGQVISMVAKDDLSYHLGGEVMYNLDRKGQTGEYIFFPEHRRLGVIMYSKMYAIKDPRNFIRGVYIDDSVLQKVSELYGYVCKWSM